MSNVNEVPRPDQVIVSTERSEEIGVAIRSMVFLLDSITEEELQTICIEAERDSAFGPFLDPTAYQSGDKFRLNRQMKIVANGLLALKKELANQ